MMTLSLRFISGRTPGTGGVVVRKAGDVEKGRADVVMAAPKVMGRLATALSTGANLDIVSEAVRDLEKDG